MKSSFAEIDSISRLGGDEFVVFTLGNIDENKISFMMDNFFQMIKNIEADIDITCSAGICFTSKAIDYDSLYYNASIKYTQKKWKNILLSTI